METISQNTRGATCRWILSIHVTLSAYKNFHKMRKWCFECETKSMLMEFIFVNSTKVFP